MDNKQQTSILFLGILRLRNVKNQFCIIWSKWQWWNIWHRCNMWRWQSYTRPSPCLETWPENLPSMKELIGSRQVVQAKPEECQCSQCPTTYKSASCLCKHIKSNHSPTLHCGQCTQDFAYSQLEAHKKKPTDHNICQQTFTSKGNNTETHTLSKIPVPIL